MVIELKREFWPRAEISERSLSVCEMRGSIQRSLQDYAAGQPRPAAAEMRAT